MKSSGGEFISCNFVLNPNQLVPISKKRKKISTNRKYFNRKVIGPLPRSIIIAREGIIVSQCHESEHPQLCKRRK